jgi:polysaccharide export outer membrane protein
MWFHNASQQIEIVRAFLVVVCRLVRLGLVVLFIGLSSTITAQETPPGSNGYIIGPEDVLEISVWKNKDLSRTVPVRPDGRVSLPLLNDIQAAGLTPTELADTLTDKLKEYITVPQVSVIVTEVHSVEISIIGEVSSPGRYELRGRITVLDALALAGKFNDFAARSRIFILRTEGTATKRIPFNYDKVIANGGGAENILLQPNDIIVVP